MVKKLEKRKTAPKIASQPPTKQIQKERGKKNGVCKECLLECKNATYQE
jgi:hypothetical protein